MKCKWCDTEITEGNECDNCWEMRHRMENDIALAEKILKALKKDKRDSMIGVGV